MHDRTVTPQDVAWAQWIVNVVAADGRSYVQYPNSGMVYQVYRERKQLVLQNTYKLRLQSCRERHERTREIFAAIGWEVKTASDWGGGEKVA